jgi:mannose-1-phosphate guanylyltransferase
MFLWRVDTILDMFSRHMPELHERLMSLKSDLGKDPQAVERFYQDAPSISIDYGIMEKAERVAVIPVDIGWSDVGGWDAMGGLFVTDDRGNSVRGPAELINSDNNVIWAGDKRIVLIGVNDLVVVAGDDAILVCPRPCHRWASCQEAGRADQPMKMARVRAALPAGINELRALALMPCKRCAKEVYGKRTEI